jgi:hypothetical protein
MQRIGPKKEGSAGGKDQALTVSYFCPGTHLKKIALFALSAKRASNQISEVIDLVKFGQIY